MKSRMIGENGHTVSNDGHVTDVGRAVHETPDLFDSEVDHLDEFLSGNSRRGGVVRWREKK
jgi:hypothetical protein